MNEASSRSHAIFTVMVEHDLVQENGEIMVCTGKLNLVDLAGRYLYTLYKLDLPLLFQSAINTNTTITKL